MAEETINKKKNQDFLKFIVIALACFTALFLIFGAGMAIGGMKARFSYKWAESYHKNFAGPKNGFFNNWQKTPPMPGDFIEGHGAFGEIIEINENGFVIKGRGEMEKVIVTTNDTIIKKGAETIENNLEVGCRIVVVGEPNQDGQIEAKLIRIFDEELEKTFVPRKRTSAFYNPLPKDSGFNRGSL